MAAIRFYGQSSHRVTERSRAITRLLPQALAQGEIQLHYQPLVEGPDAPGHRRGGAPALGIARARRRVAVGVRSPRRGSGPHGDDRRAGSCAPQPPRCAPGATRGFARAGVAVNVSLCQLVRGDLAQVVRDVLEESGIDPSMLELELSERGVLRSDPEILRQLHDDPRPGRAAGHRRLRHRQLRGRLPQAVPDRHPEDRPVVRARRQPAPPKTPPSPGATIAMARQLGLRVVAEGVEEPGADGVPQPATVAASTRASCSHPRSLPTRSRRSSDAASYPNHSMMETESMKPFEAYHRRLASLVLCAVSLAAPALAALVRPIRFDRLSLEQGLSQSTVQDILQDRRGYIWLATEDGLNRYDGLSFKVYKHDPADPASLPSSFVWDVEEDADGNLWIATAGGLAKWERATDRFVRAGEAGGAEHPGPALCAAAERAVDRDARRRSLPPRRRDRDLDPLRPRRGRSREPGRRPHLRAARRRQGPALGGHRRRPRPARAREAGSSPISRALPPIRRA